MIDLTTATRGELVEVVAFLQDTLSRGLPATQTVEVFSLALLDEDFDVSDVSVDVNATEVEKINSNKVFANETLTIVHPYEEDVNGII